MAGRRVLSTFNGSWGSAAVRRVWGGGLEGGEGGTSPSLLGKMFVSSPVTENLRCKGFRWPQHRSRGEHLA